MKLLLTIMSLLILSTVTAFGQFWNKPDASYTFSSRWGESMCSWAGMNSSGFRQVSIHSDTLIDGNLFTRYYDYSILHNPSSWTTLTYDTTSTISEIAFYEEDSILYAHHVNMDDYQVSILYDFTKQPGESWTIPQEYLDANDPWNYYCGSSITVTVLDTGHVIYQGVPLYYLSVAYSGGYQDTIFERLGGKRISFLSISNRCKFNGPITGCNRIYQLKCYSDDQIWLGENCTSVIGVEETKIDEFSIYPNPASQSVTIKTKSNRIQLTDVSGRILSSIEVKNGNVEIDVSALTNGIYFIRSDGGNGAKLIVEN